MPRQARQGSDPRRLVLRRLAGGPTTQGDATKDLKEGRTLLQDLVASGLVAAVPPTPPQRAWRYALTDEGRRELERLEALNRGASGAASTAGPGTRPDRTTGTLDRRRARLDGLATEVQALAGRVDSLAARVDSLAAQLQAAVIRLEAVERAVGTDGKPVKDAAPATRKPAPGAAPATPGTPLSTDEFERLLYHAYDELDRRQGRLGLVPIPRLREALSARVEPEDFERRLRELAKSRRVFLVPHDQPATLSDADRRAAIEDRVLGQLYYWVRWKG